MIQIHQASFYIHNLQTRMPFRYGIAEMTAVPHLMLQLKVEVDHNIWYGVSADSLPPKWFTKDPGTPYQADIEDMLAVVNQAIQHGIHAGEHATVFDLWWKIYQAQEAWAQDTLFPSLLWNFGVSLVERAMIDAFCKAHHLTFSQAIQENVFGIRLDAIHPVLEGSQPRKFIPHKPLPSLVVRHTVGLADYLTDADIPSEAVLFDGLPQSLEANIRVYGLCYFKIKVSGDMDTDIPRLKRVATILDQECPAGYTVTLDGNEQFKDAAQFRTFWEQLQTQPDLVRLLSRMLWVEQPIHREFALAGSTRETILNWEKHPLMIIDESDSELESLPIALTCGYAGTSHKNCKGVFKGFANACLLAHYQDIKSEQVFILSGEDLANVGPVALLQDLVVMAVLGISHVERNGHHYFSGLSLFPLEWQNQVLAHHADLYQPAASGFPTLRIENGQIQTHSILHATFGYNTTLDFSSILQIDSWDYESLNTAPAKSTS